jgi:phage tail-like protein
MRPERIARFLPEIYRLTLGTRHGVLDGLLDTMASLHQPSEEVLDDLDSYVDPMRAPDRFLPMLAGWLDLAAYLDWSGGRKESGEPRFAPGPERLRLLAMRAAEFNARRGTRAALEEFLSVATGLDGFSVEENPPDAQRTSRPFHVRVHAPDAAKRYADLVARIVEGERPAYVTYEIVYASGATPAPSPAEGESRNA